MAAYRRVYDSIICRLTAKNRDQLRNPMLDSRVWATFFTPLISCGSRRSSLIAGKYRTRPFVISAVICHQHRVTYRLAAIELVRILVRKIQITVGLYGVEPHSRLQLTAVN